MCTKGSSFVFCLTIVTLIWIVMFGPHTAGLHQAIVSIYWVGLFAQEKIPNLAKWDKSQPGNSQPSSLIGACLTLPNLGFLWVFFKYPKISKNGNLLFFSCVVPQWLLVIGVLQTSLIVGGFRSEALLVLWKEETDPSAVCCGRDWLSWIETHQPIARFVIHQSLTTTVVQTVLLNTLTLSPDEDLQCVVKLSWSISIVRQRIKFNPLNIRYLNKSGQISCCF